MQIPGCLASSYQKIETWNGYILDKNFAVLFYERDTFDKLNITENSFLHGIPLIISCQ